MSYFGGSGRIAGDPGFFDAFKGALGGFIRGGPIGAVRGGIRGFSSRAPKPDPRVNFPTAFVPPRQVAPSFGEPGFSAGVGRAIIAPFVGSGGAPTMASVNGWPTNKDGTPRRAKKDGTPWKRPTMNPTNPKALMRAARRADSFVRVARRVLKNTGWKISSKSSGKLTQAAWEKKAHHAK